MTLPLPGRLLYLIPYPMRQKRLRRKYPRTYDRLRRLRSERTEDGYSLTGCDERDCLFVHIPKCAGLSIARALFGDRGPGHLPIWAFEMAYDRREFASRYKFAFVRNPWDRVVSAFYFLKDGGMSDHDAAWAEKQGLSRMEFEEFVLNRLARPEVRGFYHFQPQHYYLCDPWGRIRIDHVARFEQLTEEYDRLRQRLNASAPLEHVNVTANRTRDYRECYTEAMRRKVAEVYRRDIRLLDYPFDPDGSPA